MKILHVIAQGDGTVPYRDELGRLHPGRAMGRSADGQPVVERVADTTYVRRALGRQELAIVDSIDVVEAVVPQVAAEPEPAHDAPLVIQRGIDADATLHRTEP